MNDDKGRKTFLIFFGILTIAAFIVILSIDLILDASPDIVIAIILGIALLYFIFDFIRHLIQRGKTPEGNKNG